MKAGNYFTENVSQKILWIQIFGATLAIGVLLLRDGLGSPAGVLALIP
ncbi:MULTISPECIES: hypothetical protein [Brasilonema]|jgi:hypothetical protein|nr:MULTISPECIES: hypothetical protein [Brasilonema]